MYANCTGPPQSILFSLSMYFPVYSYNAYQCSSEAHRYQYRLISE